MGVMLAPRGVLRTLFLSFLFGSAAIAQAADPALFYFFSPDWRPGNLGLLAESVEAIAAQATTPLRFQAFARYEDFLEQLHAERPAFLIAPTWVERLGPLTTDLQPLAMAERNNKTRYRKALMTRPEIESLADLDSGTMAATIHAMGPAGERTVLDAFNLDGSRIRVVPVQKDIDALLALSFEQVDAALVTSAQFEAHARVRPTIIRDFHIIGFSPEIDLPVLYRSSSASDDDATNVAQTFVTADDNETGRRLLALLGLDRFREPTPSTTSEPTSEQPSQEAPR